MQLKIFRQGCKLINIIVGSTALSGITHMGHRQVKISFHVFHIGTEKV